MAPAVNHRRVKGKRSNSLLRINQSSFAAQIHSPETTRIISCDAISASFSVIAPLEPQKTKLAHTAKHRVIYLSPQANHWPIIKQKTREDVINLEF